MAIDEKHLDDISPGDSAVDRLRKRNKRIRPWETALVDSPSPAVVAAGEGVSPSGQVTPRGKDEHKSAATSEPTGSVVPPGERPSGRNTSGFDQHLEKRETASYPEGVLPPGQITHGVPHDIHKHDEPVADPQGNSPLGPKAPGVTYPQGNSQPAVPEKTPTPVGKPPGGQDDQRVNDPEGALPGGQVARSDCSTPRGNSPSRRANQRANNPRDETPPGSPSTNQQQTSGSISLSVDPDGGFDPRPFLPERQSNLEWREKGYGEFRIPHRLFEFVHRVTTTRNELLVLNCMLRFSLGFHRTWCEAGYSFIASWTGISDLTNVRKSVRSLVDSGIVRKTREHDCASNSGSVYELPVVEAYLSYLKASRARTGAESGAPPEGDLPSGSVDQRATCTEGSGRNNQSPTGETPPKKERLNQNSKKSLSQSLPPELTAYLDQVRPAAKRESEIFFLGKLLEEYSASDVDSSLRYVLKFGALGNGEKCHSPIRYLSTSMEQVRVKAEQEDVRHKALQVVNSQSSPNKLPDEDLVSRQKSEEALREFERSLSSEEQDAWVSEARRENTETRFGYVPPDSVLRGMAAISWQDTQVKSKANG